mmetsp:Transcript_30965/g.66613  ORF Transcript_30965/g.66613 Transcript_30965/m.66613 type:complete len:206 (-) Transcript_30965:269-886(-)
MTTTRRATTTTMAWAATRPETRPRTWPTTMTRSKPRAKEQAKGSLRTTCRQLPSPDWALWGPSRPCLPRWCETPTNCSGMPRTRFQVVCQARSIARRPFECFFDSLGPPPRRSKLFVIDTKELTTTTITRIALATEHPMLGAPSVEAAWTKEQTSPHHQPKRKDWSNWRRCTRFRRWKRREQNTPKRFFDSWRSPCTTRTSPKRL